MLGRTGIALVIALTVSRAPAHADPAAGTDFATEASLVFRIAACGSDDAVAKGLPAKAIKRHCKSMQRRYASYRKHWVDRARDFIATIKPAGAPTTVVYPFGGGDLASALTTFPDATEITTISLEAAGDIRVVDSLTSRKLTSDLGVIGRNIGRLYRAAHSTTKSLQNASHSKLPGTIVFALAALAVHGYEPRSLRYFELETDGSIRYLTAEQLDQRVADVAKQKKKRKRATRWREQVSPFGNVEITYAPPGDTSGAVRTYRHIVANLDDAHLGADARVIEHLAAKGKVATMTKAASFLLWSDDFAMIRTYLLDHMAFMVSDASGIPPSYATPAGFEQIPFGTFTGPYFTKGDKKNTRREFIKLWKAGAKRKLPFRYGYPDAADHPHLLLTQPSTCKGAVPC